MIIIYKISNINNNRNKIKIYKINNIISKIQIKITIIVEQIYKINNRISNKYKMIIKVIFLNNNNKLINKIMNRNFMKNYNKNAQIMKILQIIIKKK